MSFDVINYALNKKMIANVLAPRQWIEPTLLNGWVNNSSSEYPVSYMKDSLGFVHIRGTVKDGTPNATIFTLPVGYRPAKNVLFVGGWGNSARPVYIYSNGDVHCERTDQTSLTINCYFTTY